MGPRPQDPRTWQDQDSAAQHAVDELRRGLQRVRQQVRSYREMLQREPQPDRDER